MMRKTSNLLAATLLIIAAHGVFGDQPQSEKLRALNWLQVGDGYKALAPIPNGDNFLLVGNDDTIYRKGYGPSGAVAVTKASGPVDQIVSTQGNAQIGFDFIYSTNGWSALYGYDGKSQYPIGLDGVTGKITCLCYDGDHGLFCGTDKGHVYQYVNNPAEHSVNSPAQGWFWKDLNFNGKSVFSIVCHPACLIVAGSYVDPWKKTKESFRAAQFGSGGACSWYHLPVPNLQQLAIPATKSDGSFFDPETSATPLLVTAGEHGVIAVFETVNMGSQVLNDYFTFLRLNAKGQWEHINIEIMPVSMGKSERILKKSRLVYDGEYLWGLWGRIDGEKLQPFRYDFASKSATPLEWYPRDVCRVDTVGTTYAIDENGRLLRSAPEANKLSVEAVFVSQAAGDSHKNDAIYKLTVTGAGLTRDQIFKEGLNGFKYKISSGSKAQYAKYAYPIAGARYMDTPWGDQAGAAALNPRTISFLWMGPKNGEVTVEQAMNGKPFGKPVTIPLPPAKPIEPPRKLTVEIVKEGNVAANTGTCAFPFSVKLQGDGNQPLPDTSELYNCLVFYKAKGSTCDPNALAGADPLTDGVAIMPNDCVEVDGFVKYGSLDSYRNKSEYGRHFYLFVTGDVEQSVFPAIIKDDGSLATAATTLKQTPSKAKLSYSGITLDSEQGPTVADFHLTENGEVACSNISQPANQNGAYHGYLDFMLRNDGVFYLFPQGLSAQSLDDRLNPANLSLGFFCAPIGQDEHNPFWADKYQVGAYTGLVEATRNKNLHLIVFDRYGRTLSETKQSGNGPIFVDRIASYVTNGTPLPIIMASKMRPFSTGKNYKDKSVNGRGYSGIPAPPAGLFMPPNMPEFTTYYTDAPDILEPPFDDERLRIDFLVNTVLKKNYSLCDCSYLEIWEVPKMEARCQWQPGNVWFINYASIVMGVKVQQMGHQYIRLHGICVACLPRDEVGRYNWSCFLEGSSFKTSAGDCHEDLTWVFNEGYDFKTKMKWFPKSKPSIERQNSHWRIPEVRQRPTIPINSDVKSALGR